MRDFARLENARAGSLTTTNFSASACQKIHSELLESVNQIYQDMKRKPLLKRNAISTSSIAHTRREKAPALVMSKSIDLKSVRREDPRPKTSRKASLVPELEAKKNANKKPSKVGTEDRKKVKTSPNETKKKKRSLSVADKMSLLKIKQKA